MPSSPRTVTPEAPDVTDTPMTERQRARHAAILRCAEELFLTRGYARVSIDELVGRLGISKATIYDSFGSKLGLVEAVVREVSRKLEERLEEIVGATDQSVEERMLAIARHQNESVHMAPIFLDELRDKAPDVFDLYHELKQHRIRAYYERLVDEGIASGELDGSLGRAFILRLYLEMSRFVSHTDMLDHVPLSRSELGQEIVRAFVRAVRRA